MMKKVLVTALVVLFSSAAIIAGEHNKSNGNSGMLSTSKNIFLQSGNINSVFRNDGYFNYDKVTFSSGMAGMIWPVSSATRLTTVFTSGIWIGAKTVISGNQKELRLAASMYNTHFSPGNIPVNGQVPPTSVCNDPAFDGYLVSLTDETLVNGGVRTKTAAGRTYTFNYSPWSAWPVNLGAPYVEVNGVPGYQPGWNADRPGTGVNDSRPSDMIFTVFMDYTNCTNNTHMNELSLPGGTLPLGVEVQQLAYAYSAVGMLNSYFVRYKIINKSGKNWDSTYIGLVNDGDLGGAEDDAVGCDSIKNLAYTYNFDNDDPEYGIAPPAVGYKVIQGPMIYTGNNTDTSKLPCEKKIGYKMIKMTGHSRFASGGNNCNSDPDNYLSAYNFLQGLNGCAENIINPLTGEPTKYILSGNGCIPSGWIDSTSGDKRNLISTGPFNMASGDTQTIVYAYAVERGSTNILSVCSVMDALEYANSFYYDCSGTLGIEPVNNFVPMKFNLEQNYPNPFNPVTNIRFDIPKSGFVKLVIFDALGREVNVLVNGELQAGTYNADWNASDVPSGIYFYKLDSGGNSITKKMVLVK